jgi:DNA-binding MarR family transcriptional regulator
MLSTAAEQADFSYDCAQDGAGLPASVAIFGADALVRAQIAGDLGGAGFRCRDGGALTALIDGPVALLGDVVVVDCPASGAHGLDGAVLAGLARLDLRAGRSGARLIVATNLAGLDDVFAVMDQSRPQILVSPSRAERVIAVGRVIAETGAARVREMVEEDRVALLRLSQQVEAIARSIDRMTGRPQPTDPARALGEHKRAFHIPAMGETWGTGGSSAPDAGGVRQSDAPPAQPSPQVVRQIIANRQARTRFFDAELFGDPAWDMLLDLTAAHGEGAQVSVTSLCIAAGVPTTTALRWLTQMVESGLFVRVPDPADRRRAFIALSEKALAAMAGYFASLRTAVGVMA